MTNNIYKSAGILIHNKKLLVERSKGKEFFISPGGSVEKNETPEQALIRELSEEFDIVVLEKDLKQFGEFSATAVNNPGETVHMKVFVVSSWVGEPSPNSEVEEIAWISSKIPDGMKVGSIFEHEVIPRLKIQKLIN